MLNRISIFWTILIALLITSAIPLSLTLLIIWQFSSRYGLAFTQTGNRFLWFVAGIIGLVVLVAYILARQITKPLLSLAKAAEVVEAGQTFQPERLEYISNGSNEIAQLASVFSATIVNLQEQMAQQNSIYAMSQTITAALEYDKTLQTILASVKQVVAYDAAEINIFKDNTLVVEAWAGEESFKNTTGRKYRLGQGLTGKVGQTKEPLLMSTIQLGDDNLRRTLGYNMDAMGELLGKTTRIELKSFLGVPLLIGPRLIGVLSLVHHEAEHFTEHHLNLLNALLNHAAIAVENALTVQARTANLEAKIKALTIEIDQTNIETQISAITESDYFKEIEANAEALRKRFKKK